MKHIKRLIMSSALLVFFSLLNAGVAPIANAEAVSLAPFENAGVAPIANAEAEAYQVSCVATMLYQEWSYSSPEFTEATLTTVEQVPLYSQVSVIGVLVTPSNGRIWFQLANGRWIEAYTGYNTGIGPAVIRDSACYPKLPLRVE